MNTITTGDMYPLKTIKLTTPLPWSPVEAFRMSKFLQHKNIFFTAMGTFNYKTPLWDLDVLLSDFAGLDASLAPILASRLLWWEVGTRGLHIHLLASMKDSLVATRTALSMAWKGAVWFKPWKGDPRPQHFYALKAVPKGAPKDFRASTWTRLRGNPGPRFSLNGTLPVFSPLKYLPRGTVDRLHATPRGLIEARGSTPWAHAMRPYVTGTLISTKGEALLHSFYVDHIDAFQVEMGRTLAALHGAHGFRALRITPQSGPLLLKPLCDRILEEEGMIAISTEPIRGKRSAKRALSTMYGRPPGVQGSHTFNIILGEMASGTAKAWALTLRKALREEEVGASFTLKQNKPDHWILSGTVEDRQGFKVAMEEFKLGGFEGVVKSFKADRASQNWIACLASHPMYEADTHRFTT